MKIIINKNQIDVNPEQFLRRAGYGYIRDRQRDKESFVRRLGGGFYPRLHMYFSEQGEQIIFDLHLDQKQASYKGSHMHNAEYGGQVVEQEIQRLKNIISSEDSNLENSKVKDKSLLEKIGEGKYDNNIKYKEKSWWRKLFS